MIVQIRDIAASCAACGRAEFESLTHRRLVPTSTLKCRHCGASYTYLQLIDQIGEIAMRRANQALDALKKKKPD
jgi:uncharacterized Zn finger protein